MVSLIIPTLNEATTLRRTLSGLTPELKSRYDLEVIVSDGGSSDGTLELARGFGAQVLQAAPGEKQNISIGRNLGAAVARGSILIFLDADSFPREWEELLQETERVLQDQRVVAVTTRVEVHPSERSLSDAIWLTFYNLLFWCHNLLGSGMGRGNCQVVRATAFRELGGYNQAIVASEDYDLYRRLRTLGRIRFLWGVLVYESPRRFRKYGHLKVAGLWFWNYLNVAVRGKSWSKDWRPVR